MHIEKRKHERYNDAILEITVTRPGIAGFLKFTSTTVCMDFSLSGLQFGSSQEFRIGQKLIVDLLVRDIELNELTVIVANCSEDKPGVFRTGVQFCFETSRMKDSDIMHGLLQIEDKFRVAREFPT